MRQKHNFFIFLHELDRFALVRLSFLAMRLRCTFFSKIAARGGTLVGAWQLQQSSRKSLSCESCLSTDKKSPHHKFDEGFT